MDDATPTTPSDDRAQHPVIEGEVIETARTEPTEHDRSESEPAAMPPSTALSPHAPVQERPPASLSGSDPSPVPAHETAPAPAHTALAPHPQPVQQGYAPPQQGPQHYGPPPQGYAPHPNAPVVHPAAGSHAVPVMPVMVMPVQPKSVGISLLLTFFFGPLGMLYTTVTGFVVMFLINLVVLPPTLGFGVLATWPACMIWGAIAASNHNTRIQQQAAAYARPPQQ